MDNCCDTDRSVGAGVGEQLHDRRFYSHLVGHCHYRFASRGHPGTQILIVNDTIEQNPVITF